MKFLMDQNSVLVENIASKPVDGTHGKPVELSTKNDHRGILTPEVSNLITTTTTTTTTTTVPPLNTVLVLSSYNSNNKPMAVSFEGLFLMLPENNCNKCFQEL